MVLKPYELKSRNFNRMRHQEQLENTQLYYSRHVWEIRKSFLWPSVKNLGFALRGFIGFEIIVLFE